jgi:hypothetical protein
MEGYVQWPKQEETKEKWTELFGVVESSLGDFEKRISMLEGVSELRFVKSEGRLAALESTGPDAAGSCEELRDGLRTVEDRVQEVRRAQAERALFLLEGIVQANQGSSEWCLGYLKRAIGSGLIDRDCAEHLLFNVVRVSGYWRDRFDEMFPKEG